MGGRAERQTITPLERGQLAVLIILILLTLSAWGLTITQAQSMAGQIDRTIASPIQDDMPNAMDDMDGMSGMDGAANPGMADMGAAELTVVGLSTFLVAWTVMMVAMMLPAVTPMLLLYRTIAGRRRAHGTASFSTWTLTAGYLLVWAAVGAFVFALLHLGADLSGRFGESDRHRSAPIVLGVILGVAGIYQFTPLKHACLRQCQSPLGFIMTHWRNGALGALRMGVTHGLYCLGCC